MQQHYRRSVVVALAIVVVSLAWRMFRVDTSPVIPRDAEMLLIQRKDAQYPFHTAASSFFLLKEWIEQSRPVEPPKMLEERWTVCIQSYGDNTIVRIPFFTTEEGTDSNRSPKSVYARWRGEFRVGEYATLSRIVEDPTVVKPEIEGSRPHTRWIPDTAYYGRMLYYSGNDDDVIDRKESIIDSHNYIVWEDTDHDGVFDREYIENGQFGAKRAGSEAEIRVKVPRAVE